MNAPVATPHETSRRDGRAGAALAILATPFVFVALAWTLNYLMLDRPVGVKLSSDPRNSGYTLHAHYGYYLNPNTLVLDLRRVESVAPVDLFRGLCQSAEAMHQEGRSFERIVLARDGAAIFLLKGEDFKTFGAEYATGQNPVYLVRTLPGNLYLPDGKAAFGQWSGGLLGVVRKQMEDANEAAQRWAAGE